jgi:hypothetical protein
LEEQQQPEKFGSYQYVDSMAQEFQHITKSEQGDSYAHCTACDRDICVKWIGKLAILRHQKTEKHKNAIAQIRLMSTGRGKGYRK